MAIAGTARAANNYSNTTPTTNAGPSYTLQSGDTLSNTSNITATGASQAAVQAGSGVSSITNSGVIQGTGANGLGVQVISGGSVGSITNGGTILATNGGAAIILGDTIGPAGFIGTLTNSGLIQASGAASAIQVEPGSTIAAIVNSSGTIAALGSGAAINALGTIGTISNGGLIQSATGAGIAVASTGYVGAITNAGTIAGGVAGILNNGTIGPIGNSGVIGSIVNNGEIMSASGPAISNGSTGVISNGVTNTATGTIVGGTGGVAIDNSTGTAPLVLSTAGTIIGDIKLGANGDTVNVTGGRIAGAINGVSGGDDEVNFSPSGVFTTSGSIANVDTINVTAGTLALQQPVTGALSFAVDPGATAVLNSSVAAGRFYNAGVVNVGTGHQTITGNYTQASSGALGIGVVNTTNGSLTTGALTVTGAAVLQGTTVVAVDVPTTVNLFRLYGTSAVMNASSITATGSLVATSDNGGVSFNLANSGTQLLLSPQPLSQSEIQTAAANDINTMFAPLFGILNPNQRQAELFLQQIFVALAETGHTDLINTVYNIVTNLTPSQVLVFNNQLLPSTAANANQNLTTTTNVLSGSSNTILSRLTTARQTGLAAGDEVGRGITFWGQPFGALTNQGPQDGTDGYSIATYGITFGGDALVTPTVRAGAAVSLSNSDITYNGSLSGNKGTVFAGQLSLYGTWYQDNFFVDGILAFGYNHYTRTNLVSALGLTMHGDSGGTELNAKVGAGYDFKLSNGAIVTPYVSLQQFHINFGSYTTTGGSKYDLDMHVNSASSDTTESRLGAKLAYPVKLQSGGILTPDIHLYWLHDFGANQLTMTYTSADIVGPNSFFMTGPQPDRDTLDIGVGLNFAHGPGWSVGAGYDYAGRSSLSGHNFWVNLKLKF